MTDADEAAFSAALRAKFPELVFAVVETEKQIVTFFPTIDQAIESDGWRTGVVYAWVQAPGWRPEWVKEPLYS